MGTLSDEDRRERIARVFKKNARKFSSVPVMSVDEALRRHGEGNIVLVDVRSPTEQQVSMAEGAITAGEFERTQAVHTGKTVVTYCTVGFRSGHLADLLRSQGWDAYNMEGAILGWVEAGGALVSADGPTKRVHTWSGGFDLLPDGYEAVW
ncbi:MAG: rhodanese-like domain-containing protein [Gemmatimonadota bacterium]|nr:rhodanese-like domain-containing protein [Gemmatimonadota bacterium]MDH5197343.1 rhodanese-like domain-containing protein [Gemmatimonadota bacterium]